GPSKPTPGKRKNVFGDDDEITKKSKTEGEAEDIGELNFDDIPIVASQPTKPAPSSKSKAPPSGPPTRKKLTKEDDPGQFTDVVGTRQAEKLAKEAQQLDPSVYDYDAAFDVINAGRTAAKVAAHKDAAEGKSKYMEGLLEAAELRKMDQLRARDKVLQREREAEGDEFADKEKFVTGAYKAQQEEARKAEAEEQDKQAAEEEKRRKMGMAGFHKQMLMEEENRHQAAMDAAAELAKNGYKADETKVKTAEEIARELNAQGGNIIINDDGEVADKRQLLSAGLNIVAKPKSAAAPAPAPARPVIHQSSHQGRGSQRGTRDRQTRMIADQIEQAAKRTAEQEAEERKKVEEASKSRKTEGDISSAKERYLQRKKEAAAAK
ncbi:hypothetical protein EJ04DRAFT_394347, partial [Polyplosphaeria fusca]